MKMRDFETAAIKPPRDAPSSWVPAFAATTIHFGDLRRFCRYIRIAVTAALALAVHPALALPDSFVGRLEALALVEELNADLLSHDSATATLERWCGAHGMAAEPKVVAHLVHDSEKPPPAELRTLLGAGAGETIRYRRVELSCGEHVLSEADNWYLPARLTSEMNDTLEQGDMPFGRAVAALRFRRRTLTATLLWNPLPDGWEGNPPPNGGGDLAIPRRILEHRAILTTESGTPFSALIEIYTNEILNFPVADHR